MEDQRVDTYALEKNIHTGPRTLLYLATRKSDGAKVIVKTLPMEYRPSDADRIRNEFAVATKLTVPGMMRPLELGSHQGRPAVVLEYFEGDSLHAENQGPMQ